MKRLRLLFPTFIALFAGLVSSNASASGVSFEILVESEAIGDASTVILIIKNEELLFPIDQIVVLEPGDTISVQIETNALGMPGVGVSALGSVLLLGDLTDSSHGAQVTAEYHARVDARGGDAISAGDFFFACVAINDCDSGGLPFGDAAIISDTVAGNAEIADGVFTPLPGFGGVLEQMVTRSFSLPGGGPPDTTFIDFNILADTLLFDNGDTAGAAFVTLDIEVGPIIPVPAAVWLFGSALGLLGWVRRKPA